MTSTQNSISLLRKIASLPKELRDQIYEFNVEYRPKMKCILNLFQTYKPYRLTCEICNITKIGIVLSSESVEEFICSKKCFLKK